MNKHKLTELIERSSLAVKAASLQTPQSTRSEPSVSTGRDLQDSFPATAWPPWTYSFAVYRSSQTQSAVQLARMPRMSGRNVWYAAEKVGSLCAVLKSAERAELLV